MDGTRFVDQLKAIFEIETDAELAELFDVTQPSINQWKNAPNLTPKRVARAIKRLHKKTIESAQSSALNHAIEAIIEYAPIRSQNELGNKGVKVRAADGYGHLRLRSLLENEFGIYIFYSSLCRPIYIGKANKTELWTEINSAFNRSLKLDIHKVNHPRENQKSREVKLGKTNVNLFDVATYISAYKVEKEMIDNVEALIIRLFINELSNVKVENIKKIEDKGIVT